MLELISSYGLQHLRLKPELCQDGAKTFIARLSGLAPSSLKSGIRFLLNLAAILKPFAENVEPLGDCCAPKTYAEMRGIFLAIQRAWQNKGSGIIHQFMSKLVCFVPRGVLSCCREARKSN